MQTAKHDLPSYLEERDVSMVPLVCVSGAPLAQMCGITGLSIHGEEKEGPAIQSFGANQSMHREQGLPGTLRVLLQARRSERHKHFLKQHFLLLISSSHQA